MKQDTKSLLTLSTVTALTMLTTGCFTSQNTEEVAASLATPNPAIVASPRQDWMAALQLADKQIRDALKGTDIKDINPTPIDGIYEIVTDSKLMYSDAQGKFLFVGGIFDQQKGMDITKKRKLALGIYDEPAKPTKPANNRPNYRKNIDQQAFDAIKQYAIQTQKGSSAAPTVYMFSDPMCSWCSNQKIWFEEYDLNVMELLVPNVASRKMIDTLYCSGDVAANIKSLAETRTLTADANAKANCDTKDIDKVMAFAKSHGFTYASPGGTKYVTPVIILPNGTVNPGAIKEDKLPAIVKTITEEKARAQQAG